MPNIASTRLGKNTAKMKFLARIPAKRLKLVVGRGPPVDSSGGGGAAESAGGVSDHSRQSVGGVTLQWASGSVSAGLSC